MENIRLANARFTRLRYRRMGGIARSWDPATVSALAAIFGSFVGGGASTLSARLTERHHDRKDLLAKRIAPHEPLYSDFISESARAMADAMQHTLEDPSRLTPVYALIRRIRLSSLRRQWRARSESPKPSLVLIRRRTSRRRKSGPE